MVRKNELIAQGEADEKCRKWTPLTLSQWVEERGGMSNLLENEFMIKFEDLTKDAVYTRHAQLFTQCANYVLAKQSRQFIVDEHNRDVLKFLLYYFNGCAECEKVFPNKEYKLGKQILLYGAPGVGKTLIMEAFSVYLRQSHNPMAYANISLTQLMNHFRMNDNLDLYTFNTGKNERIEGKPFHLCLNDIGIETHRHFGTDPKMIVEDFLYSRNDIYVSTGQRTHLTTNLDKEDIRQAFSDEFGRLSDRIFKTYNFIPLLGESRR